VPADRYWIVAHAVIAEREHWGATSVDVHNGKAAGVAIALVPDAILSGTVSIEAPGAAPAPALTSIAVILRPVDSQTQVSTAAPYQSLGIRTATVHGDGKFSLQLPPGRYVIEAFSGRWALSRAVVGGRDQLGAPVDVRAGAAMTAALTLGPR
jgi:hypothetical protein